MLEPDPGPLAIHAPLLWACTRDGAFALLGNKFHLVTGTQGRHVLQVGYHPRGRWFLATPSQYMELVGTESHRVKSLNLTCMAVDCKGEVWLGTENDGLERHMGKEFRHYRVGQHLPDERVRALAEDSRGHVFVGTAKGLAVFDRPRWLTVSWEWPVTSLDRSPTGRVWVGLDRGAACFEGMHMVERLEEQDVPGIPQALMDGPDGSLWLALGERGLWRRTRDGDLRRVPLEGEAPNRPAPHPVTRLLVDPDGTVWAALPRRGVARIDGGGTALLGLAEGLVSQDIESLGRWPTPH